jgi:hypothetical protein
MKLPLLCSRKCGAAALQMHADDGIPVGLFHLVEDGIAQYAGIVDHAIDAAEGVDGSLDHAMGAIPARHRIAVGNRLTAGILDRTYCFRRRAGIGALAAIGGAQIVDHHLGAVFGHGDGDIAADAAACAGDQHDFAVEKLLRHVNLLLLPAPIAPAVLNETECA